MSDEEESARLCEAVSLILSVQKEIELCLDHHDWPLSIEGSVLETAVGNSSGFGERSRGVVTPVFMEAFGYTLDPESDTYFHTSVKQKMGEELESSPYIM